jgi:hypothetical protein
MTLQIEFTTTEYQYTHGKKPAGYGLWAFAEVISSGSGKEIFAPHSMTLTQAKKWLKQYLLSCEVKGSFLVKVCP